MSLLYKIFGIPRNIDELTEKANKNNSSVNILVKKEWEMVEPRLDLHAPRYDIVLKTNNTKLRIKGQALPIPGYINPVPLIGNYSQGSSQDYERYENQQKEVERATYEQANEIAKDLRNKGLQVKVVLG